MFKNHFVQAAAFVALVLSGASVAAKPVNINAGNAAVTFEIPDNWKNATIKRGLEMSTPDSEVFLWVESYPRGEIEKVKQEHGKYFSRQGVVVTGEPKLTTADTPGYGLAYVDLPATWNGKPTVLRYIAIEPKSADKNPVLVTYWASPEGDKTYDAAMQGLINSLAAALGKAM